MPPEEIKKRDEEKVRRAQEETEEATTQARRRGFRVFVYGHDFAKVDTLKVRFTHPGTGVAKEVSQVFFKNSKKLAVEIPDLGSEVPIGNHMVTVEVSINGQQFSTNGL